MKYILACTVSFEYMLAQKVPAAFDGCFARISRRRLRYNRQLNQVLKIGCGPRGPAPAASLVTNYESLASQQIGNTWAARCIDAPAWSIFEDFDPSGVLHPLLEQIWGGRGKGVVSLKRQKQTTLYTLPIGDDSPKRELLLPLGLLVVHSRSRQWNSMIHFCS